VADVSTPTARLRPRRLIAAGLLAAVGLAIAACSSGDAAPDGMVAQGSDREWCDAVIRWHRESDADRSAATGDVVDRAAAERIAKGYTAIDVPPPAAIAADVHTVGRVLDAIATGDTTNLPDQSAFTTASQNVTAWVFQNCGGYDLNR
jgi:hypothetical protein